MNRLRFIVMFWTGALALAVAGEGALMDPANRLTADAPQWRDLVAHFAKPTDHAADFEERRYFPFRKEPVVLKGEVRVSAERGLSLHYTQPEERIVVVDQQGMLTREPSGQRSAPMDPRASLGTDALRYILRLDFTKLEKDYEMFGQRGRNDWTILLVPRVEATRRAIGDIFVAGDLVSVRRIELRRSAKQHIDITIGAPWPEKPFGPQEIERFFR